MTSKLALWQKIDALRIFIIPAAQFDIRCGRFNKSAWRSLNDRIRALVKQVLTLQSNASNSYLYGHRDTCLIDVSECHNNSDIALIDGAYKLLTSPDQDA